MREKKTIQKFLDEIGDRIQKGEDHGVVTNTHRAEWAALSLDTFRFATMPKANPEEVLGDFLADLLHWCDKQQISFDGILTESRKMYEIEKEEDPP